MRATDVYQAVSEIVDPVYLVGGSVRDALMGRECVDFDFATPLDPDRVEALIRQAGRRPYLVGKRFGTVGMRFQGRVIEITTFRSESYPDASRKPDVEFLDSLAEDLARRDFTINALAMRDDRVFDPWGGQADMEARLIRAVGEPLARFREDPLRMLRAARFASQLQFSVEPQTALGMAHLAPHILGVAKERWCQELDKLLLGPDVEYGLRLLAETNLLRCLLPELQLQLGLPMQSEEPRTATPTLFEQTLADVASAPADVTARWAALLGRVSEPYLRAGADRSAHGCHADCRIAGHDLLGAQIAEKIGLYLKWSTKRRETVARLVRDRGIEPPERSQEAVVPTDSARR